MKKLLLKHLQFGFCDIRESQIEHFEGLFVSLYRSRLLEEVHYKVLKMRGEGFAQVTELNEVDAEVSDLGEIKEGLQVTFVIQTDLQVIVHIPGCQ